MLEKYEKFIQFNEITCSKQFKDFIIQETGICPSVFIEPTDIGYLICSKTYNNPYTNPLKPSIDLENYYIEGFKNHEKVVPVVIKYFKEYTDIDTSKLYYDTGLKPGVWA